MTHGPLPDRPAFALTWGRQAADCDHFRRVYAAVGEYGVALGSVINFGFPGMGQFGFLP